MKILFITGCIEEGKDGIGDYTLILSSFCNLIGHESIVIGLNDFFVKDSTYEEKINQGGLVKKIRLSSLSLRKNRFLKVKNIIHQFKPDFISFQYCGYSYHPKGVPFNIGENLKKISGSVPIQIMFHELWAGSDLNSGWKSRLWGAIQQWHVKAMIKRLDPFLINVSTLINKSFLKNKKVESKRISILSNIPIIEKPNFKWIVDKIMSRLTVNEGYLSNKYLTFGFFGTLYSNLNEDILLPCLLKNIPTDKKIIIISAGKMGSGKAKWDKMEIKYPQIYFIELGYRSAHEISEFLQFIDFGISTTSPYFLNKSGTYMAMEEHGLSVFVCEDNGKYPTFCDKSIPENKHLIVVSSSEDKIIFDDLSKAIPFSRSKSIAEELTTEVANKLNLNAKL